MTAPAGTVVRAPNHLGDCVMALPALAAARPDAVVARRFLVPLLETAGLGARLVPLDRGTGALLRAAGEVRRGRYARGVLLAPSLSSALLFALAGVPERRGTRGDARDAFLTDPVPMPAPSAGHRASLYLALATGTAPAAPPVPALPVPEAARARWRALAGRHAEGAIGVFPGSNAPSRRWAPARFAETVRRVAAAGYDVVVFGGPGEEALSREAAGGAALDLGGRTDLATLAAGLASCRAVVTNDSGPMHLAAAVGTPVVALFGAGEPRETGPLGAGHRVLRHPELPCVPCRKNVCPRAGRGTFLQEAERECLALVGVDEVVAAAVTAATEARERR